MKKINKLALSFLLMFSGYMTVKACSPLNTPVMTATAIVGNNLLLNMNSVTLYNCSYYVEVELVCNGSPFPGIAPFYYTSPTFVKNSNPFAIPQMTVNLSGLCQGGVYQYRWREVYPPSTYSPWSAANSFTMPGVPIPTTLTLNASPPSICFPQTSQLTASVSGGCGGGGVISYSWIPATGLSCNTCSNPVANPTITTTYTCIVSGSGPSSCWTASNVITITSFTSPPAVGTLTAPASLCVGQSNTISVSSFSGSIQWQQAVNGGPFSNIGAPNQTVIVTPTLTPGNYCYHIVATGCGATLTSAQICTTVSPLPNVTVNSPSICAGQVANLAAGGASSYTWAGGAIPTGVGTATASPPVSTSYTVTGALNGCTASAVSNVTVYAYPVVNLTSNGPVCNGNPLNLTTTGSGSFQWTGPNGFNSNMQNPVIPVVSPVNAGVYNVVVSANNCATGGSINVVVLNPTVSASNFGPYCAGFTASLNASSSPVSSYNWAGPGGFTSAFQNPSILNAQAGATGIYTVTVSDGTCSASALTSLTVFPLPNSVISSNAPICESTSLTLSATGGVTYNWSGPNNYNSNSPTPVMPSAPVSASGIYTVMVTDTYGCQRSFTLSVGVLPKPLINATGAMVCLYGNASIGASANNAVSYNWTGPNGYTSNLQNPSFTNLTPGQVGAYTVVVTGVNSCTSMAATSITVFPVPQPTAYCTPSVCLGGKVTFTSEGGLIYNWKGPNAFISHDKNTTLDKATSVNYSGTYTLGVIDEQGCQGFTTVNLLVRPLPTASIVAGLNDKCVPYCASYSVVSGTPLMTTSWNMNNTGITDGNTFNYCFNTDGSRVLRTIYSDAYGCANISSLSINVYPIPMADFHYGPGEPVETDQIQFTDASLGPEISKWSWYFKENGNNAFYQNPTFVFEEQGNYPVTLIISNKWGCKDTITKPVLIKEGFSVFVPNSFSPNGDGVNDTFQPKGYGVVKYQFQVFNQWGEKLFETDEFTKGWDGMHKGKMSKEDIYVWKMVAYNKDGKQKEYSGHVSLLK